MINLSGILKKVLKEQDEAQPQDAPKAPSINDFLNDYTSLRTVLSKLLTSDKETGLYDDDELNQLLSKIEVVQFKPTTFRVTFKNGNNFSLTYDPSPSQIQDIKRKIKVSAMTLYYCKISGKRYYLGNRSEYYQCLKYINKLLTEKPIGGAEKPEDVLANEPAVQNAEKQQKEAPAETPEKTK
jgi:hypothetical protein